jgi:hypothetical protein
VASPKSVQRCLAAASLATLAALLPGPALAAPASAGGHKTASPLARSLLQSRLLWATIDVCSPTDQPNTVGIRGSMPGDGLPHDTMFMSFRLQYLNATTKRWADLDGAASGLVAVGTAKSARQAGRSFTLTPVGGKPAATLRGVVTFQWRRGAAIVQETSRPTTAGRRSLAGADPASFSAATCSIS